MKKTLISASLLALCMFGGALHAKPYSYPNKVKPHFIAFGVEYQDATVDRFEFSGSSPSFTLGYGYRFSRYFELGANVSVKTGGAITDEFADTYAIPDHSAETPTLGEPTTTVYKSRLNNSVLAGLNAKVVLPIADNFDLYATVGGTYGRIEHRGYAHANGRVYDNKNHASTIDEYLTGIANGYDECYLTGVESVCPDGAIVEYNETFDSVSLSYGGGLRWLWRDGGSVHMVNFGASSLFRKDDFRIFAYGITYEYQF